MFKKGFVRWDIVDSIIFLLMIIFLPIGLLDSFGYLLVNTFNFSTIPMLFYFFLGFMTVLYLINWLHIVKRIGEQPEKKKIVKFHYYVNSDEKIIMAAVYFSDMMFLIDKGVRLISTNQSNYNTYLGILLFICAVGLPFFYLNKMKNVDLPQEKEDET